MQAILPGGVTYNDLRRTRSAANGQRMVELLDPESGEVLKSGQAVGIAENGDLVVRVNFQEETWKLSVAKWRFAQAE